MRRSIYTHIRDIQSPLRVQEDINRGRMKVDQEIRMFYPFVLIFLRNFSCRFASSFICFNCSFCCFSLSFASCSRAFFSSFNFFSASFFDRGGEAEGGAWRGAGESVDEELDEGSLNGLVEFDKGTPFVAEADRGPEAKVPADWTTGDAVEGRLLSEAARFEGCEEEEEV